MKRFITYCLLSFALLALATAQAQTYAAQSVSVPATIAGATTTNVAKTIDVRRQDTTGLQISFNMTDTTTSNVVAILEKSLDGSTWGTESNSKLTITMPSTGTTQYTIVTNLSNAGAGYWRLYSLQNTHATLAVSNLTIKYSIKIW